MPCTLPSPTAPCAAQNVIQHTSYSDAVLQRSAKFFLHNTLRQIRLLVVLTPGGCVAPTAVPGLVQTVYMGCKPPVFIYGYPKAFHGMHIEKSYFCHIKSTQATIYIRYQKRGTSVMSNKGSLIDRGDTQIIYRHQHKRSQLNKACRCATISRTYEETASK